MQAREENGRKLNYGIRSWQLQNGLPEETIQAFVDCPLFCTSEKLV